MPYDDPSLSELRGYFKAKEPGKRARAEAWATAIGLQNVDGLSVSRYLVEPDKVAIDRLPPSFEDGGKNAGGQKKVVRKGGQKTVERLLEIVRRLRRVGPDKGGHWEVGG